MCSGDLLVIGRSSAAGASTPHSSEVWASHVTRVAITLCTKFSSYALAANGQLEAVNKTNP